MNNFDNLRKLLPECLEMYKRLEAWRYANSDADTSYNVFKEYIKDNNKLVEKVVKAFYKDTKEYNSWETLQSTMLAKCGNGGEEEYSLHYPFEFVTETLGLQYTLMIRGYTNYKSGYLPNLVREYNSRRERSGLGSRDWPDGEIIHQGKVVAQFSYNGRIWEPVPRRSPVEVYNSRSEFKIVNNELVNIGREECLDA